MNDAPADETAVPPGVDLRGQAEARLGQAPMAPPAPADMPRVLHELQVHQIELELQNEELRRTQELLETSRARYFDLYELAPVGYVTLGAQGLILEANLTAASLLGVDRGRLLRQPLTRFIHPEDQDGFYRYRRQLLAGGGPQVCELRMLRTDDAPFWARVEMAGVKEEGEGAAVWRTVLSDITAQKQAEAAMRQSGVTLEQRVAERTVELSTAIRTLSTQAETLRSLASELTLAEQRERSRLADTMHDGLQQLLVAARLRAFTLAGTADPQVQEGAREIIELLEGALVDTRSLTAELAPPVLRTGGLVAGLHWLARWSEETHRLAVRVRAPAVPLPLLPEDLTVLLFRSVRELLFNTVKYAQVAEAAVIVARDEQGLTLTVADAGTGFDPRALRGEGGVTGGFGLAGIRSRLELLGGCMNIDSAPGRGSRITLAILLPRAEPPTAATEPAPPT